MHIDLRQLRHFVALAEHHSFGAAATAVNLSQSAFSRSIQALEHSVGCRLVDRTNKDLCPTKQGLLVLEHARRLVHGARNLANEISQFNSLQMGVVRFGAGPAPASQLIPRAVGRFISDYPKAQVQLQVDCWQELNRRLASEEIEFFVADTRRFEVDPDYRVHKLKPQRWHFYCRAGHPLSTRQTVCTADIFDYPLATTFRPPNIRKVLVDSSGRQDFAPSVECEHAYALLNVVLNSDAIGIAGLGNLDPFLAQDSLVMLELADLSNDLEEYFTRYGIVSRSGYSLSPLALAMTERIIKTDEAPSAPDTNQPLQDRVNEGSTDARE
ncbi:LysR family transcriptional regulator [Azomonas macrocytogenes]|uniref:DNA-binding transcriptional LysR family regulator n=1 Tax=Azomonas macrocytogenes TaxID=69962 RepID=A0A839T0W7_AZOMA|nr:LysR family transcriptional regulator [Azomonas macrocytogenes]MBB3102044.1 DNA-binding transcriptional LysR family regulator [Azomonas macrocytogenes]